MREQINSRKEQDISKRSPVIDIVKGIGILLVVAGHCYAPGSEFYLLFHMAVFYIASGYGFHPAETWRELRRFLWKRVCTLWVPFAVWTILFVLLHNRFLSISIYTDNPQFLELYHGTYAALDSVWSAKKILLEAVKGLCFLGGTQMSGALWFLRSLFLVSCTYACVTFVLRRWLSDRQTVLVQTVLSACFLFIGSRFMGRSVGCLTHIFSYYYLYHAGVLFRRSRVYEKEVYRKLWCILVRMLLGAVILIFASGYGSVGLDRNAYTNPCFFVLVSLAGFCFLYACSQLVARNRRTASAGIYIGRRTLPILIFHFLAFKLVNYIGIRYYGDSGLLLAAYPVAYMGGGWWLVYMLFGTALPLCAYAVWERIKKCISINMIEKQNSL